MKGLDTLLFPFPHRYKDERRDGSLLKWPDDCSRCIHNKCNDSDNNELQLCSYGYNYQKVDDKFTVAGIIVRDTSISNHARNKLFKNNSKLLVSRQMLNASIETLQSANTFLEASITEGKEHAMEEYVKNERYKPDFLEPLKDEIQKGLSFVHDYKQINTQIIQNINVIIESRYEGITFEEKLSAATREEKAIYEASKFLDEKLIIAKFLMHPEWLDIQSECVKFRFHGVVIKYRRIYSPRFEKKGITISFQGKSFNEIVANPQAVAVIPHTFLDNASKYSPNKGRIDIYVQDIEDGIEFSVSSFGPRILPAEKEKIFNPFYRGKHAKKIEEEGAGYGLYICQLIAQKHLGTVITVDQDHKQTPNMGFWTSFSIKIPFEAKIL